MFKDLKVGDEIYYFDKDDLILAVYHLNDNPKDDGNGLISLYCEEDHRTFHMEPYGTSCHTDHFFLTANKSDLMELNREIEIKISNGMKSLILIEKILVYGKEE